jgi:hypothetical protein
MATYAHTTHTAVAATFTYAISFSYERTDDVKVYLDDVEIDRGSATDEWIYSGTDNINITLGAAVGHIDDQIITIKRVTDISDAAVVYTNGSGFSHTDINTALNQLLFAIDELQVPAYQYVGATLTTLFSTPIDELHGLGAAPTRTEVVLACTSSDLGYSSGDFVSIDQSATATTLQYVWNATKLTATSSSAYAAFTIPHKSTRTQGVASGTKWLVIFKAWR